LGIIHKIWSSLSENWSGAILQHILGSLFIKEHLALTKCKNYLFTKHIKTPFKIIVCHVMTQVFTKYGNIITNYGMYMIMNVVVWV
jgi:hypothetical protein